MLSICLAFWFAYSLFINSNSSSLYSSQQLLYETALSATLIEGNPLQYGHCMLSNFCLTTSKSSLFIIDKILSEATKVIKKLPRTLIGEVLSEIKNFCGAVLKFNTFNLVMKKILCTFASELVKGRPIQVFIAAAFFIAVNQNSLGCCFSSDSRCKALSVFPKIENNSFYNFKNIFNPMGRPIKSENKANNSTLFSKTLTSRQADLLRRVKLQCLKSNAFYESLQKITGFQTEMNAKNEAYCYILSSGLLDDFITFCYSYVSDDPHRDCITYLTTNLK